MSKFKNYQRKQIAELRPYETGETLDPKISVSDADLAAGSPKEGDMIARNPKNHDDQWLVAKQYFEDNFEDVYPNLFISPYDAGTIGILRRVYPSKEISTLVRVSDEYGGAHEYQFKNSKGFNNGEAEYDDSYQRIQFVKKESDGSMTPGLQSEQLIIALIDRHKKLNEKFPSREGALAITKMEESLQWLQARVQERIERGVMGYLTK